MDTQDNPNPLISVHVPVALVALALSILFLAQIKGVGTATETMKWQGATASKQIAALKENREKLTKAIEERTALVKQSEETQKKFTELLKDVDALARGGDEDAKKIIVGYGIKIAEPAASSEPKPEK
jgi:uncharacterized protein YlxW (UPF0749 family)